MATRPQALHEAVASLAVAGRTGSGRLRVRIIEADRWGSSAYYPATVLKRDGSVFKAGTHTYFDHPTVTEAVERPERSVRDLAGRLVTDAEFDGDGLYAEMEVFPHYRDLVESMAGAIGLSIRAQGTVEYGEMAGRSGPILTAFTEAESVDFVTAPGAGGKIVALLESARALAEGRHSAPWREEDHPRGYHGRFGNGSGSGGSDGGSGGGSTGGAPNGGAPASRSERGMPSVLSTTSVPLTGGGSARLDRHTSGDVSLTTGNHTTTLSRDNADTLVSRLRLADDWDVGDEESFGGAGHIRKTGRSEYEATLPDGTALNVTRRDVKQMEKAFDRLDGASRVDTGNGDADIFVTDDKKIGFRHLGDDGRPVEAAFTRGSFGKISRTIDELIDEADFPDDPDNPITRKVIATNLGKVRVELLGGLRDGPGSRLEIMPVEGDAWGVVVDSAQKYDWFHAMDQAASASGLTEARRSSAAEVPRGKAPFQKTKDDDEDPDEQDEDDKGDEDEDGKPPVFLKTREAARQLRRILADLRTSRTPLTEARNVGAWIESRLHLTLTQLADDMYGDGRLTRPERISLSSAVGDALTTFTTRIAAEQPQLFRRDLGDQPPAAVTEADRLREGHGLTAGDLGDALSQTVKDAYGGRDIWVWVRDHTDDWVVFSLESAADCGLYQQAYTVAPDGALTLTGDATEVTARTTYTPKPGAPTAAENEPGIPPTTHTNKEREGEMPELTEAEARQLTEARDQADAARQAAEQQAATAARELARFHALEAARPIAVTILAESGLPPAAQTRLLATVTAASVPLGESSQLDEAALRTAVSEAAASEARYLASLAEADGAGRVRGLGESTAQGEPADSAAAAATTTGLVEAYKSRGLSEEAARLAAAGRPF